MDSRFPWFLRDDTKLHALPISISIFRFAVCTIHMYPEVDVNQPAFGPCAALLHVSLVKSRAAAEREVVVELRRLLDRLVLETRFSWSVPIRW